MTRRGFLSALGIGAAGFVLDPEMLLWKPGAKTIFLPSQEVFTGNTFITPSWITRDVALFLENSRVLQLGWMEYAR